VLLSDHAAGKICTVIISGLAIPEAQVESAVGKALIDFYDPFSLYTSDLYELG